MWLSHDKTSVQGTNCVFILMRDVQFSPGMGIYYGRAILSSEFMATLLHQGNRYWVKRQLDGRPVNCVGIIFMAAD
jgi:hypothetical protein